MCNDGADGAVTSGIVCEVVEGGKTGCFAPVVVEGRVVSIAAPNEGVKGARVVARDVSGALVSRDVAVSGDDNSYQLAVPSPRKAAYSTFTRGSWDGLYTRDATGRHVFHEAPPPRKS